MRKIIGPALAGVLLATNALSVHAQTAAGAAPGATTLDLSAYGEIQAPPDRATITLGVQAQAATAVAAMHDDAARMTALIGALHRAGIADKDIQTSNLNLEPQYDFQQNQPPKLNGYLATNDVTIVVDDLARLGPAVDATVSAGANQVNGIAFSLKDPRTAQDAARRLAVTALRDKAALYASATGLRVTRLVNLSEGGAAPISPVRPMAMMRQVAAAATPISAGELTVRVDITGVYELAQ